VLLSLFVQLEGFIILDSFRFIRRHDSAVNSCADIREIELNIVRKMKVVFHKFSWLLSQFNSFCLAFCWWMKVSHSTIFLSLHSNYIRVRYGVVVRWNVRISEKVKFPCVEGKLVFILLFNLIWRRFLLEPIFEFLSRL
jgi:hypothetical protein